MYPFSVSDGYLLVCPLLYPLLYPNSVRVEMVAVWLLLSPHVAPLPPFFLLVHVMLNLHLKDEVVVCPFSLFGFLG